MCFSGLFARYQNKVYFNAMRIRPPSNSETFAFVCGALTLLLAETFFFASPGLVIWVWQHILLPIDQVAMSPIRTLM